MRALWRVGARIGYKVVFGVVGKVGLPIEVVDGAVYLYVCLCYSLVPCMTRWLVQSEVGIGSFGWTAWTHGRLHGHVVKSNPC